MSRILVTGGEGFVGSYLIRALVEDGHEVVSLDIQDGTKLGRRLECERVQYVVGNTEDIEIIFDDLRFDVIFHLGEYARVEQSRDEPALVFKRNVIGTFQVVEFWRRTRCRLVYTASSTAFVDEKSGKKGKNLSPYTYWKDVNSNLIQNYGVWYKLDYAVAYLYNAYGPGEPSEGGYSTLIGKFLKQAREGSKLTVRKPGSQRRNFTHVQDIADGLRVLVSHSPEEGREPIYRFGSAEHYSILEVVDMFGLEFVWLEERPGNRDSVDPMVKGEIPELQWKATRALREYINMEFLENKLR